MAHYTPHGGSRRTRDGKRGGHTRKLKNARNKQNKALRAAINKNQVLTLDAWVFDKMAPEFLATLRIQRKSYRYYPATDRHGNLCSGRKQKRQARKNARDGLFT